MLLLLMPQPIQFPDISISPESKFGNEMGDRHLRRKLAIHFIINFSPFNSPLLAWSKWHKYPE
jgi:hypothetical protein